MHMLLPCSPRTHLRHASRFHASSCMRPRHAMSVFSLRSGTNTSCMSVTPTLKMSNRSGFSIAHRIGERRAATGAGGGLGVCRAGYREHLGQHYDFSCFEEEALVHGPMLRNSQRAAYVGWASVCETRCTLCQHLHPALHLVVHIPNPQMALLSTPLCSLASLPDLCGHDILLGWGIAWI